MLDLFVYLCILHLIHRNVIFDILEPHAFQKYSTCWVFEEFEKIGKVARYVHVIDKDKH